MKILFDQGTPLPLKNHLVGHEIQTAFELGWSALDNGDLIALAEESFDLLITTDQQLRYQRNLSGRKLAIVVLMTTSWPRVEKQAAEVREIVEQIRPAEYGEITFD